MLTADEFVLLSVTVIGALVTIARVTVPMVAGLGVPSVIVLEVNDSAKSIASSSLTSTWSEPVAIPGADAVMVTRAVPSRMTLLIAVSEKVTDAWPAGIVTVVGAFALL